MDKFQVEMRVGQVMRTVDGDNYSPEDGWLVFFSRPPQGGTKETWRVRLSDVVSITRNPRHD